MREDLKSRDFKRVIVRMPNWIGDLMMASPVLADLRRAYPDAHIAVMCRSPLSLLLKENPYINEVIEFDKKTCLLNRTQRKRITEKLRQGQYDLGILLTHSLSSAWWFWQGKVLHRIGYDCNGRRWLLTHPVSLPKMLDKQHLVMTYKLILESLGLGISTHPPELFLSDGERDKAKNILSSVQKSPEGRIVGINPGATYGSAKCWLPARFREVTSRLIDNPDVTVVFFGDRATVDLVNEICFGFTERVINLAGATSLREVSAVIALCDVLLTNDSGLMHIADALGVKIVALFGSTNEIVTGPYREAIVIHKHVACSPCHQRKCPIDFRCMKQISSQEVYDALMKQLNFADTLHVVT